ncbi:hypothetical protein M9Y10_036562 [Tritrichomonas musculus]|uniref:Surface antigen BspA-like n=1 Tax=Tritrichomonas musculus TaxID=1915356 RepID=A0ABR2GUE7_9EUKA
MLETITIPSAVVLIGDYEFSCLFHLKEVIFESRSSMKAIGTNAFAYTKSIKRISLPSSMTVIDDSTFEESQSLEEVIISSSVTKINTKAFKFCESLKEIVIPLGVTSIEEKNLWL